MEATKIFKVKIYGMSAELEFTEKSLTCITGDTVHFDVTFSDIRVYEFQKPNKIALNFYKDFKMLFLRLTSKNALSIVDTLKTI